MKKRCNLLLALAIVGTMSATAQVRIGGGVVPNSSAVLDLNPDDQTTSGNSVRGLAMPRVNLVSTTDFLPLHAHIHGMTVFNMVSQNDVTPGIYYNDGTKWLRLSTVEFQLPDGVTDGDMFVWNAGINQWEAQPEKDGVVGNEVENATDESLTRSGAGTLENPYTLAVSENGIESKHLKDGAVTNQKIVNNAITSEKVINKSITKEKLGDDVWNEITQITEAIQFEEEDGIVGNEVADATDNSLTRSGNGASDSPYTLAVALEGIENKHIKDGSITGNKIVNKNISKEKLGDDVWMQVKNEINNLAVLSEADSIIGNEVVNATDNSLMRSGLGTTASPYTLAVSAGGIDTQHLKDGAVTTEKIANNAITTQKVTNKSITKKKLGDDVWSEVKTEITNSSISSEVDGIIGNEVIGSADASLTRSGSGTAVAPYRLAVSAGGIETIHLKDGAVTTAKIANNAITTEKVVNNSITKEKLGTDVWTQITQTIKAEEADGVIGNEVTNATDGSLVRTGTGTSASPYTLAVAVGGIETKHIKDGAVTTEKIADNTITVDKLADAQSSSILYTDDSNNWAVFTRKVATGVFNVPNDGSLTRCALTLPDFGAGLYGINIVCDSDLPLSEGEIVPSLFRFITDTKPYGAAGTRDVYFDSLSYFSQGDSHTTTAWLYDCKPNELELYCTNTGQKPVNFRIVCTWLMPF